MAMPIPHFGPWRLLTRLHEGGMAGVWLAQKGDEPPVVLKLVHDRFAHDATFREMLEEEARVAARVRHPNVIRVLEAGVSRQVPYLVMEHCDGATVAAMLDQSASRPIPVPVAVAIAAAAAEGLHAAHEAVDDDGAPLELVHRDVSPTNVMVSFDGEVKLIDFGIARARGRAIETSAGTLKGKFNYLAPEAIVARGVDRGVDIYALGIVLWEMLTGRRYLDAKHEVEVLMMARHPRWTPAGKLRAEVPEALDHALRSALEPRRADRCPSARAFADAIRAAVPEAAHVSASELGAFARSV